MGRLIQRQASWRPPIAPRLQLVSTDRERTRDLVARRAFLPGDLRMRATAAAALKQPGARGYALARRQLGVRLGERPSALVTEKPALAPAQDRRAPRQGQIANPHDRAVFDGQRRAPAPPTTPGACDQLD
jgi:hypothetical protein